MNALVGTQMSMAQLETQRRSVVSSLAMVSLVLMPPRPGMTGPWELAVRNPVVSKHVKATLAQLATWPAVAQMKLEEMTPLAVRSALHRIVKLVMQMDPNAKYVCKDFV